MVFYLSYQNGDYIGGYRAVGRTRKSGAINGCGHCNRERGGGSFSEILQTETSFCFCDFKMLGLGLAIFIFIGQCD